jgi:EpsG family
MSVLPNTTQKNSILLFLLWPFFALMYALRNYKAVWAKDIIWFFVMFHGFTLTFHNTGEETIDANRYQDKFITMAESEVSWQTVTTSFYNAEEQSLDILETIIIFLLSRFTNNTHILFAVFGLIFGYFYSRNIWYLIERAGKNINASNIPVIFTFAFIVGFWQISGFRFWTATHIFFYGTLPFIFEGKKKYLWFSFLAGFMHFSYFFPLSVVLFYMFTGSRTKIFFFLFVATFFLKELSIDQVSNILTNNLPAILQPKVKTYTNAEVIERKAGEALNVNWYIQLYNQTLKWTVVAFLIVIFLTGQEFLARHKRLDHLLGFTFLFYSFANILGLMPSGNRFISIANLFALTVIFFYVQFAPRGKAVKRVIFFSIPLLAFYSIVAGRVALDTMGFFSVFGNPVMSVFINVDITLIEMVKGMIGLN